MKKEKKTISYRELANLVGDMVLANDINKKNDYWYDEIENGSLDYIEDGHEYTKDIYQSYIITSGGAEFLEKNTDEIVQYYDELGLYIWHVTHFGTPWNGVYTEINKLDF